MYLPLPPDVSCFMNAEDYHFGLRWMRLGAGGCYTDSHIK